MTDTEHTFLMLFSAIIASDTEGNMSYDKVYDMAEKAQDYYYKRKSIDARLPEGVTFPLYKEAIYGFFKEYDKALNIGCATHTINNFAFPQSEPVFDKDIDHKVKAVFSKYNIRQPAIGFKGLKEATKTFCEQYAFSSEYCREVYDYMHDNKFIKI